MKLKIATMMVLGTLVFAGCANRDQLTTAPTPTPGDMDVDYTTPTPETQDDVPPPPSAITAAPSPTPELPAPPSDADLAPPPSPTPLPSYSRRVYVVKQNDTLWGISGKQSVLGDEFRWPLLFKANRTNVKDPDVIWPGLQLAWKANYPMAEIEDAVQKSKDTPAYVPHFAVRKQLPIDY